MNDKLRIVILLLPILGLSACATTDERSMYTSSQETPRMTDRDEAYMGYVERVARSRGVGVMWVNPPRRKQMVAQQIGD